MLKFSLFGFPVGIQPGFWFLVLIIGISPNRSIQESLSWVGIIFVSVMIHELGHAIAARAYGEKPVITLHMMGGLTSWTPTRELSKKSRILVTLAGPLAGFALAAASFGGMAALSGDTPSQPDSTSGLESILGLMFVVNIFWSAINLMPVLPFDGGQILAAALGPERKKLTATVSLVFGLITGFVLYRMGSLFGAAIFGLGGISSFMAAMRSDTPELPDSARRELATHAKERLEARDFARASSLARVLGQSARSSDERVLALEILAWAALGEGNLPDARAAVQELNGLSGCDPYLHAAVALADGDQASARRLLETARAQGDPRPELLSLSVRVELETEHYDRAAELAGQLVGSADPSELRQVATEADQHGAPVASARLLEALFDSDNDPEDAFAAAQGFARADQADDALRALSKAVKAGHPEAREATSDADIGRLADDPRFARALAGEEVPVA